MRTTEKTQIDVLVSACHLPHDMLHFFLNLQDNNLPLAATFLACEVERIEELGKACAYPLTKSDWERLREFSIRENVPTDFFDEQTHSFIIDLPRLRNLQTIFLPRLDAWKKAMELDYRKPN